MDLYRPPGYPLPSLPLAGPSNPRPTDQDASIVDSSDINERLSKKARLEAEVVDALDTLAQGFGTGSISPSTMTSRKRGAIGGEEEEVEERPKRVGSSGTAGAGSEKGKGKVKSSRVKSCAECRRLKLKCNVREQTPCSMCVKRGVHLVCPDGEVRVTTANRLVVASNEQLHARILALEKALQASHVASGVKTPHPLLQADALELGLAGRSTSQEDGGGAAGEGEDERAVEMSSGQLTSAAEGGGRMFFGTQGGSAFLMDNVADSEVDELTSQTDEQSRDGHPSIDRPFYGLDDTPLADSFPFAPPSPALSLEGLLLLLPDKQTALALAETHFQNSNWMWNIVDSTTFNDRFLSSFYPSAPSDIPTPSYHKLAVVNMVFALGSLYDLDQAPFNPQAARFHAIARACMAQKPTASIFAIQTISLMGSYLLNGPDATKGGQTLWPFFGLALKWAQSIGLHRDGSQWGLEPSEVEERRRVFWEIYAYDTIQAFSQGRPRGMHADSIDTKLPFSNLTKEDYESPNFFHVTFYRFTALLAEVNDIQTTVKPIKLSEVMDLDRRIRTFYSELPKGFHLPENLTVTSREVTPAASRLMMQKHTCAMMNQEALLYLHRSFFPRALRERPDEPLKSVFAASYVAELEAAMRVLQDIDSLMRFNAPLATRFWFFFFHSFSACVTLATAVIQAPRSSMADAAMTQLDAGLIMLEVAAMGHTTKKELPWLRRLRDQAYKRISDPTSAPLTSSTTHPVAQTPLTSLLNPPPSNLSPHLAPTFTLPASTSTSLTFDLSYNPQDDFITSFPFWSFDAPNDSNQFGLGEMNIGGGGGGGGGTGSFAMDDQFMFNPGGMFGFDVNEFVSGLGTSME